VDTDGSSAFLEGVRAKGLVGSVPETKRILIVDDDRVICEQLVWALSDDYEVHAEATVDRALGVARSIRPHLVMLDLSLTGSPGETEEGFELLKRLIQRDPSVKVVMVTASDDRERAVRAIELGAFDYYVKPVDLDELRVLIRRALYVQELERTSRGISEDMGEPARLAGLIGSGDAMRGALELAKAAALSAAPVVIVGESGTGRRRFAETIHGMSDRASLPFVTAAGGALSGEAVEREIFGRVQHRTIEPGWLERAAGGTLFLRDLDRCAESIVERLRGYVATGVFSRIGGGEPVRPDVRFMASMESPVAAGPTASRHGFLGAHIIEIPPLRERGEDVLLLAREFLDRLSGLRGRPSRGFGKAAVRALLSHGWPGNVTELENRVRSAVLSNRRGAIAASDLGLASEDEGGKQTLSDARHELERGMVAAALRRSAGNVSRAARSIGVSRPTMYDLIRRHGLKPVDYKCRNGGTGRGGSGAA
jgi:two-component system NtrC family response regulator